MIASFAPPGKSGSPPQTFEKAQLTKIRAQDNAVKVTYGGTEFTIDLEHAYGIEFDFETQKVICYSTV